MWDVILDHLPGCYCRERTLLCALTSQCLGSTPGSVAVMRGHEDTQPWVHPWSKGRGQEREAKGCTGLRNILRGHQLQIPLAAIFVRPITDNKIVLWSNNPAEHRKSRGRVLHILVPPSKAARLNINHSCHSSWGTVEGRRGFLSIRMAKMRLEVTSGIF